MMHPKSLLGAFIGGIVGAGIWALVAFLLDIEIGYVAVLVGVLAGAGSMFFGGKGMEDAIFTATIAILAVILGSFLGFYARSGGVPEFKSDFTEADILARYEKLKQLAPMYHEEAAETDDFDFFLGRAQIKESDFSNYDQDLLVALGPDGKGLTLEQFSKQLIDKEQEYFEFAQALIVALEIDTGQGFSMEKWMAHLDAIDVLFWVLAAAAAFQFVNGKKEEPKNRPQRPQRPNAPGQPPVNAAPMPPAPHQQGTPSAPNQAPPNAAPKRGALPQRRPSGRHKPNG